MLRCTDFHQQMRQTLCPFYNLSFVGMVRIDALGDTNGGVHCYLNVVVSGNKLRTNPGQRHGKLMCFSVRECYPLTTPMGLILNALLASPAISVASATRSTFLYAKGASSVTVSLLAALTMMPFSLSSSINEP